MKIEMKTNGDWIEIDGAQYERIDQEAGYVGLPVVNLNSLDDLDAAKIELRIDGKEARQVVAESSDTLGGAFGASGRVRFVVTF